MSKKRPRVRIRFKYNMDTGEIEEFIIDDNAREAKDDYHDSVARAIAGNLSRNPEIEDAGMISLSESEEAEPEILPEWEEKGKEDGSKQKQ